MERAYDFHELFSCANTLNQLVALEYGNNGLQFPRTHNKMENIWAKSHHLMKNEHVVDLGDYINISNNYMLVVALKEGLKEA